MMNQFFRLLAHTSLLAVLASCSPMVDARGHNAQTDDYSQIVTGQSRNEDVQAILGSPSAKSNFGEETWYYISGTKETVGLFEPEITEQHVTAISFDEAGLVKDIANYTKKDGKQVKLVGKETATEGHKLTFMEQMLGNVGRFNAPTSATNPRDYQRR
jgi:outer membrane protein assembly factor BamE (lipoprotein component of BamABCDE complex)